MFLVGFRSGQHVEKQNKEFYHMLSLTPAPTNTLTPTPTPKPSAFKTYRHTQCRVEFVIPADFEKTKETTNSARFEENEEVKVALSCDRTDPFTKALKDNKTATGVARLNPSTGRRTFFFINKAYFPLITNTIKFVTTQE